jgi:hypothetical protein
VVAKRQPFFGISLAKLPGGQACHYYNDEFEAREPKFTVMIICFTTWDRMIEVKFCLYLGAPTERRSRVWMIRNWRDSRRWPKRTSTSMRTATVSGWMSSRRFKRAETGVVSEGRYRTFLTIDPENSVSTIESLHHPEISCRLREHESGVLRTADAPAVNLPFLNRQRISRLGVWVQPRSSCAQCLLSLNKWFRSSSSNSERFAF